MKGILVLIFYLVKNLIYIVLSKLFISNNQDGVTISTCYIIIFNKITQTILLIQD